MGKIKLGIKIEGIAELREKLVRLSRKMERKVHDAMQIEGRTMENIAKADAPVRKGTLRGSIYSKVDELTLEVGARAPYAVFQELGTKYIEPKGFLKNAIWRRKPYLIIRIQRALGNAIKEESS